MNAAWLKVLPWTKTILISFQMNLDLTAPIKTVCHFISIAILHISSNLHQFWYMTYLDEPPKRSFLLFDILSWMPSTGLPHSHAHDLFNLNSHSSWMNCAANTIFTEHFTFQTCTFWCCFFLFQAWIVQCHVYLYAEPDEHIYYYNNLPGVWWRYAIPGMLLVLITSVIYQSFHLQYHRTNVFKPDSEKLSVWFWQKKTPQGPAHH